MNCVKFSPILAILYQMLIMPIPILPVHAHAHFEKILIGNGQNEQEFFFQWLCQICTIMPMPISWLFGLEMGKWGCPHPPYFLWLTSYSFKKYKSHSASAQKNNLKSYILLEWNFFLHLINKLVGGETAKIWPNSDIILQCHSVVQNVI